MSLFTLAVESITTAPAESPINLTNVTLSLVTALISALVATLMTHALNRKRARDEWARQRVFEAIVYLNESFDCLVNNKEQIPLDKAWDSRKRRDSFEILLTVDESGTKVLRERLHGYRKALQMIQLLVRAGTQSYETCTNAEKCARTFVNSMIAPFSKNPQFVEMSPMDVIQGVRDAHAELKQVHNRLVSDLADTYLSNDAKSMRRSVAHCWSATIQRWLALREKLIK